MMMTNGTVELVKFFEQDKGKHSVRRRRKNIDLSLKSNPLSPRRKNYDASM